MWITAPSPLYSIVDLGLVDLGKDFDQMMIREGKGPAAPVNQVDALGVLGGLAVLADWKWATSYMLPPPHTLSLLLCVGHPPMPSPKQTFLLRYSASGDGLTPSHLAHSSALPQRSCFSSACSFEKILLRVRKLWRNRSAPPSLSSYVSGHSPCLLRSPRRTQKSPISLERSRSS